MRNADPEHILCSMDGSYKQHLDVLQDNNDKTVLNKIFCANTTTCPLWTSWFLLPVVAEV
jgi:hypothetical protein